MFKILNEVIDTYEMHDDVPSITLKSKSNSNSLVGSEIQLFLKTLSETNNINRYSFEHDFMNRYTKTVSGAESQIVTKANSIVFGRRGAGKSMLLLYALHEEEKNGRPVVWIDMQTYSKRDDLGVIRDVISEILEQLSAWRLIALESQRLHHV